jgi:hypothetical protein
MRRSCVNASHRQDEQAVADGAPARIFCRWGEPAEWAPAWIYVRESGESQPLEGAAPCRPPSAMRESGEDAACRCRFAVRESGEDAARLCSYERETEKIMYVLVRCHVWR